jgi:hypothetical protein
MGDKNYSQATKWIQVASTSTYDTVGNRRQLRPRLATRDSDGSTRDRREKFSQKIKQAPK